MDFEKIQQILDLDKSILYVGVIDSMGNVIARRTRLCDPDEVDDLWRPDLCIFRQILEVFSSSFGKTSLIQTRREKVNELIYCHENIIIYITFISTIEQKDMSKLEVKIRGIVPEIFS